MRVRAKRSRYQLYRKNRGSRCRGNEIMQCPRTVRGMPNDSAVIADGIKIGVRCVRIYYGCLNLRIYVVENSRINSVDELLCKYNIASIADVVASEIKSKSSKRCGGAICYGVYIGI